MDNIKALERVTVVENGVDLARFDAPVDVAAVRARYDVGDRTWLVLPGRISPEKNQLALLRALASLLEAGVARDSVRLLLAGAIPAAALALVVHAAFELAERALVRRRDR